MLRFFYQPLPSDLIFDKLTSKRKACALKGLAVGPPIPCKSGNFGVG